MPASFAFRHATISVWYSSHRRPYLSGNTIAHIYNSDFSILEVIPVD